MNNLLELGVLRNRYFVMRHGHSTANEAGIIVSHPENGLSEYGLSRLGLVQVEGVIANSEKLDHDTLIVSSDFRRARESAKIAHRVLECSRAMINDARLRERFFGEHELGSDRGYKSVWRKDALDPHHRDRGVESPNQVMARMTEVVCDLENRFDDATILLVSHGDALQILQTAFHKQDASLHRRQQHLETAEIREMVLGEAQNVTDA